MPARFQNLVRALAYFAIHVEEPGKGSHWKATRPGSRPYTIPAHNGTRTEISDQYIRAVCRHFEIDETLLRRKL